MVRGITYITMCNTALPYLARRNTFREVWKGVENSRKRLHMPGSLRKDQLPKDVVPDFDKKTDYMRKVYDGEIDQGNVDRALGKIRRYQRVLGHRR